MDQTKVAKPSRKAFYLAVGASAALLVVGVLSLPYFQPMPTYATQGPSTVVCGSNDPLLADLDGNPAAKSFNPAASSTQTILSCSAPYGGVTKYIGLRIQRGLSGSRVSYRIKIDGSSSALLSLNPDDVATNDVAAVSGWTVSKSFLSTTVPIKFNSTLSIEATVAPPAIKPPFYRADNELVMGNVLFEPEVTEMPVKFLTTPSVNIANIPWVDIANIPWVSIWGQPVHTTTP